MDSAPRLLARRRFFEFIIDKKNCLVYSLAVIDIADFSFCKRSLVHGAECPLKASENVFSCFDASAVET